MGKKNKKKKNKNKNRHPTDGQPSKNGDTESDRGKAGSNNNEDTDDANRHLDGDTGGGAAVRSDGDSDNNLNPLQTIQNDFLNNHMTQTERRYFFDETKILPTRRAELWMDQAEIGEDLVNNYSWSTPTVAAFKVLKHFSPLVEVGCGSNAYWIRKLLLWDRQQQKEMNGNTNAKGHQGQQQNGLVDVLGFDINVEDGGKILDRQKKQQTKKNNKQQRRGSETKTTSTSSFRVQHGGPEVLSNPNIVGTNRTLFLCYPDDDDYEDNDDYGGESGEDDDDDDDHNEIRSFGWQCLDHFQGDIVIHVGELIMADNTLSYEQAPWGRSSSPEFQQRLMSEYHCLYKLSLPGWVHVRDTLTVWKRTKLCTMVFAAGDDDEDNKNDNNDIEEEEEEEVHYRHIPPEEILPVNVAAPMLAHLLPPTESKQQDGTSDHQRHGVKRKLSDSQTDEKRKREMKNTGHRHKDGSVESRKDKAVRNESSADYASPW